jgi:hypothetical protein
MRPIIAPPRPAPMVGLGSAVLPDALCRALAHGRDHVHAPHPKGRPAWGERGCGL